MGSTIFTVPARDLSETVYQRQQDVATVIVHGLSKLPKDNNWTFHSMILERTAMVSDHLIIYSRW